MKNILSFLFIYLFIFNLHVCAQNYPADWDHEFDNGSNIVLDKELPQEKIDRLATLCKVWGFVKYYHPEVANGNFNMDYELFRLIPKVMDAKDKAGYNQLLFDWVANLGEIKEKRELPGNLEIKIQPEFKWMTEEAFGDILTDQLEDIKTGKRPYRQYYLDFEYVGNPIFKNESAYPQFFYPDDGFRLLTLFRYWNIIEYCFPYRHLIDNDWEDTLEEFIPRFIAAKNEWEYQYTTLALIAKVSDTHANIWGSNPMVQSIRGGNRTVPLEVKFIENKAVVTNYLSNTATDIRELEIGDIIESVNGISVEQIIKERLPITPASNFSTQLRDIANYLLSSDEDEITITYKKLEDKHTAVLKTTNWLIYPPEPDYYKKLEDNIAYIYPGTIKNSDFPEIMKDAKDTRGMIIDLRCYPNEFIVFTLSEYLYNTRVPFVHITKNYPYYPGIFDFTKENYVGNYNPDYYKRQIIILINEETQSRAEYTTMAFRNAPDAIVLGSTTAGADGDVSFFYLPGNIYTGISGIGIYNPDYSETQRVGIIPDIYMEPTIEGIRRGEDELLNEAIRIIKGESSIQSYANEQEYKLRVINGEITITKNTDNKENYQVQLFSTDGRLILSDTFKEQERQYQLEKNNTVYLMQVKNGNSVKTHKILY